MNPDPLYTDDEEPGWMFRREEEYLDHLRRNRSRDLALLAFAGIVIVCLLAWAATR